jgi:hypothetical protein
MRLEAEGKARLEAMKRALAAGVPLAGLLAGAAVVGAAVQGCTDGRVMGRFPSRPPEEWSLGGDIAPLEAGTGAEIPEGPEKPGIPVGEGGTEDAAP